MILVLFSISVFLSAALLFLVEPMVAKMLATSAGWFPGSLEHLPGFLSSDLTCRIRVCPCRNKVVQVASPAVDSMRSYPASGGDWRASGASTAWLDAVRTSQPDSLDFIRARRFYRHPILRALLLHTYAAAVVRHIEKHPCERSLFPVRSEQCRQSSGSYRVPAFTGTHADARHPKSTVGHRLHNACCFNPGLRRILLEAQ